MADNNYPRIPIKNWWILRNKFQQTKPGNVSINYLATVLGISDRSAKNVLPWLRSTGLIDEEGNSTELANRWRVDDEYKNVCQEMITKIYPQELISAVPDPIVNFDASVQWFMRSANVGEPAAKQMASFYQLLTKANVSESSNIDKKQKTIRPKKEKPSKAVTVKKDTKLHTSKFNDQKMTEPSLHIDIQIHISPDTSPEIIDKLFESMSKHIYKFKRQ